MTDTTRSDFFINKFIQRMDIEFGADAFPAGSEDRVLGSRDIIKIRERLVNMRNELEMSEKLGRVESIYAQGVLNTISYMLGDIDKDQVVNPLGITVRDKERMFKNGDIVVVNDSGAKFIGYVVFDAGPCPNVPSPYHTRWYSKVESTLFTSSYFFDKKVTCLTKSYIIKVKLNDGRIKYSYANDKDLVKMDFSDGVIVTFREIEAYEIRRELNGILAASSANTKLVEKSFRNIVANEITYEDDYGDEAASELMNDIVRCIISSGIPGTVMRKHEKTIEIKSLTKRRSRA